MKTQISGKHLQFVEQYCVLGDGAKAYLAIYPNAKSTTARVKASNLLSRPEIQQAVKLLSDTMDSIRIRANADIQSRAAEQLAGKLVAMVLSAEQKKDILRQIATGELREKTYKPYFNEDTGKWESKLVAISEPTMMDRMKAIEVHNKMTGDNAPEKTEHLIQGVDEYILEE